MSRPRKPVKHGSVRGYLQEQRRIKTGDLVSPCPKCRDAWNRYYRRYGNKARAEARAEEAKLYEV